MGRLHDPQAVDRSIAAHTPSEHAEYIARAFATPGGHLAIGWGGATWYFGDGWLSGCHPDEIKAACIAAGLPVIDSRGVPFEAVWDLAVRGPMVAVGRPPSPEPWDALSYAPLAVIAEAYRAAGAEVSNLPPPSPVPGG